MNYYQELLKSYSKLKKRDLHLVTEGSRGSDGPAESDPAQYATKITSPGTYSYKHPTEDKAVSVDKQAENGQVILQFGKKRYALFLIDPQTGKATTLKTEVKAAYREWFGEENQPVINPDGEQEQTDLEIKQFFEEGGELEEWRNDKDNHPYSYERVTGSEKRGDYLSRRNAGFTKVDIQFWDLVREKIEEGKMDLAQARELLEQNKKFWSLVSKIQKISTKHKRGGSDPKFIGDTRVLSDEDITALRSISDLASYKGQMGTLRDNGFIGLKSDRDEYLWGSLEDLDELDQDEATSVAGDAYDVLNDEIKRLNKQNENVRSWEPLGNFKGGSMRVNEAMRGYAKEQMAVTTIDFLSMKSSDKDQRQAALERISASIGKLEEKFPEGEQLRELFGKYALGEDFKALTEADYKNQDYIDSLRDTMKEQLGLDDAAVDSIFKKAGKDSYRTIAAIIAFDSVITSKILGGVVPLGGVVLGDLKEGGKPVYQQLGEKRDIGMLINPSDAPALEERLRKIYGKDFSSDLLKTVPVSELSVEYQSLLPKNYDSDQATVFSSEVKTLTNMASRTSSGEASADVHIDRLVSPGGENLSPEEIKFIQGTKKSVAKKFDITPEKLTKTLKAARWSPKPKNSKSIEDLKKQAVDELGKKLGASLEKELEPKQKKDKDGELVFDDSRNPVMEKPMTPEKAIATIRNYMMRKSIMGKIGTMEGKAALATIVSTIISSRENVGRLTYFLREKKLGFTDDHSIRDYITDGLADGSIVAEMNEENGEIKLVPKKDTTSSDDSASTSVKKDERAILTMELRGSRIQCRKSNHNAAPKNLKELDDLDVMEESTLMKQFLLGQAKLLNELINQ
jgi:hypothetical protein